MTKREEVWISVNDRLPEVKADYLDHRESELVLCYMKYDRMLVGVLEGYDELTWYTTDSEHWSIHNDVTHWRPLPARPKDILK